MSRSQHPLAPHGQARPALAERYVPVLASGPGRALRRYAVDQQRPTDTHLDDEVQRRTSTSGCTSASLSHTTQRCVVAGKQW